jgi:hypothetical protein
MFVVRVPVAQIAGLILLVLLMVQRRKAYRTRANFLYGPKRTDNDPLEDSEVYRIEEVH